MRPSEMRYESTQFQSAEFSVLVTSPPRTRFCGFESPRSSRLESGLKFRGRESFVVGEVQGRPLTRNGGLVNLGPRSTQREVVRLELRDRPVRRCTALHRDTQIAKAVHVADWSRVYIRVVNSTPFCTTRAVMCLCQHGPSKTSATGR